MIKVNKVLLAASIIAISISSVGFVTSTEKESVAVSVENAATSNTTNATLLATEPEKREVEIKVVDRTVTQVEETPAETTVVETKAEVSASEQVKEVLELINSERAKANLEPLTLDKTLCEIAGIRAQEITEKWSHTRPDGSYVTALTSLYDVNYLFLGENLAKGQKSAARAVEQWMNSESHRANIMEGSFSLTGIAVVEYNGALYWAQIFIA